jgi:class 3 adenylate cyclase
VPELPHGTVTFVFTDIERSTDLMKTLGDGYRDALSRHRQIVRDAFSEADGIEIDTQGDAFFFVFARARDAVAAAVEVQRAHATAEWPDGIAVRVRIGLHTGEPAVHEEGYLGLDVVRAARICTVGKGGHILLSETTRALVGSALPEGVSVFPLGERHLRGMDEPERVYELEIAGLDGDEEAVATAGMSTPRETPSTPAARDIEKRFEDFGARLAAGIEDRVLASLERSVGKDAHVETAGTSEGSAADDLASRLAGLDERISASVAAALRAKGIDPDEE